MQNKQYSVWKLTDLDNCDEIVHFYLFGDVNKAHWKIVQNSVIGLLNATVMKSAEKVRGSRRMIALLLYLPWTKTSKSPSDLHCLLSFFSGFQRLYITYCDFSLLLQWNFAPQLNP